MNQDGQRAELVALYGKVVDGRADVDETRRLLAEVDRLGLSPEPIASALRYRKDLALPFVALLAPLLDHEEGRVRRLVLEVLRASRIDLAPWAGPVLRAALDREGDGSRAGLAHAGLELAQVALRTTGDRGAFVAAAQELVRDIDHGRMSDLRPVLRRLFPRAHERLIAAKAPARRPRDEPALLAAIREAPADDGARLVYADALLEVGDARGELIVLQCQRARDAAPPSPRERALLRLDARAWLGRLASVLEPESLVFERGFLARCAFGPFDLSARDLELGNEEWSTVVALRLDPSNALHVGEIVRRLPQLRALLDIDGDQLAGLPPADLETLELRAFDVDLAVPLLARQRRLATLIVPDDVLDDLLPATAAHASLRQIGSKRRRFVREGGVWIPAQ